MNIFAKLSNYEIGQDDGMTIYAFGGHKEVGRNCFVAYFEDKDCYIMIDCGIKISRYHEKNNYHMPKSYLPAMDEIKKIWTSIKAIFITHVHLDHCGGLPELYRIMGKHYPNYKPPVIASEFTNLFINSLFEDNNMISPKLISIESEKIQQICSIEYKAIAVPHSVPQTRSYIFYYYKKNGIKRKKFLFVSDFKFEDSYLTNGLRENFEKFLKVEAPVDVLVYDALYKDRKGVTPSEDLVSDGIQEMLKKSPKHLVLSFFASNVSRAEQVYNMTKSTHMVEFRGKTMKKFVGFARTAGWFNDFDYYQNNPNTLLRPMLLMVTGNQAEPYAILTRLAQGDGPFDIRDDYSFGIMADPIPGNEKDLRNMLEGLSRRCPNGYVFISKQMLKKVRPHGKNIIALDRLHVSGHGSCDDHKKLIDLIKPKIIVEYHHPGNKIFRDEIHPD